MRIVVTGLFKQKSVLTERLLLTEQFGDSIEPFQLVLRGAAGVAELGYPLKSKVVSPISGCWYHSYNEHNLHIPIEFSAISVIWVTRISKSLPTFHGISLPDTVFSPSRSAFIAFKRILFIREAGKRFMG